MNDKFPQKQFGEIIAEGGLKGHRQILQLKYMFETEKYPNGKQVITLIIPDNIQSFPVNKNLLKDYLTVDFTETLIDIQKHLDTSSERETIARVLKLINNLKETAENKKKPFVVKSFRFNDDKEHRKSQELMEKLSKLIGFSFYKTLSKTEGNTETLMKARDNLSGNLSRNIAKRLLEGFNEGAKSEGV